MPLEGLAPASLGRQDWLHQSGAAARGRKVQFASSQERILRVIWRNRGPVLVSAEALSG